MTNELPVPLGLQIYVLAPVTEIVELWLAQHIIAGEADVTRIGVGFTVTITVVVPVQPAAVVPVTEYVVVAAGVTE
ncbi:hypothetical protein SDC9_153779 [bioreactor metagenome]|uniref:Uncharacterized protein n=1 Tax=bioreactor metagenome TaxID=1076179 RepID=A0A645F1J4_9ZZZZ